MIEATTVLRTAGDGYWSETAKDVDVTGFYVGYINEEADFGELCVYFNTDKWNVDNDGLIYTDSLFMQQLREWLTTLG